MAWLLYSHAFSIGFYFDDYNHLELCDRNGFSNLSQGNRFDWNHQLAHVWWAQEEASWAYYRPLTVALRTALFQIFGLNALPFHLLHMGLYTLSILLFYGLLRRLGWSLLSAGGASLFFVLHPANAFTVAWLANDGPVLVGLWLIAGLWFLHASAQTGHRNPWFLAAVFACYALALASRENGISVGPLFVLFDFLLPSPSSSDSIEPRAGWFRRGAIYGLLAIEGIVYLPLRSWMLGQMPTPRAPYVHWPWDADFFTWMPYKCLNELVCLPFGLPFIPIVEVPWWQARPVTTAFAVLIVLGLGLMIMYPLRRSRAAWGLVVGIALAQAPTAIVFSMAYNYYLATVGWSILLVMWMRQCVPSWKRPMMVGAGALAFWYLAGSWGGSWMLQSAARAERLVRDDVLATEPASYPPGTKLFFINMPFLAAEVAPSLRLTAGRSDLDVYPLTFAPQIFFPRTDIEVIQEDDYSILVTPAGPAIFSGAFGKGVQRGWFGADSSALNQGPVTLAPAAGPMPFRVEVVRMDADGISAIRFVFEKPLDDAGYRFFLGSPAALAQELRFQRGAVRMKLAPPDDLEKDGLDEVARELPRGVRRLTTQEYRDFDRLRRTQITTDYFVRFLLSWSF